MTDAALKADDPEPTPEAPTKPAPWKTHLGLFLATVASAFFTHVHYARTDGSGGLGAYFTPSLLVEGAQFAGSLLTILVAHELGHYFAARIHRVDASLPFFIPLPILSPFGTMGAVIRMRGVIPTRRALLDIGASGPLAGMLFAIPLYAWGVAHSKFIPIPDDMAELGESILIKVLDRIFVPKTPDGMVLAYSPVAFGAWGGMFVTMINLLPVGQLDGGHVAYALFGPRQDRYAVFVHRAMLALFGVIVVGHVGRDVAAGIGLAHVGRHLTPFWLVWFELLAVLGTLARSRSREATPQALSIRTRIFATLGLVILSAMAHEYSRAHHLGSKLLVVAFFAGLGLLLAMEMRGGVLRKHELLDHPPTGEEPLDTKRKVVAVATLVLFVLLFMPEPFSM